MGVNELMDAAGQMVAEVDGVLREAVALAHPRPLIAIGGIGPEEVAPLRAAGAAGFAVISVVAGADDPIAAVRDLQGRFEGSDG